MSLGYRVFVVHADDSIEPISQKAFDGFFSRSQPVLTQFAGRDIHVAMVLYTLRNRRPEQIVRIDNMKVTVNDDGTLNEDRSSDALRLAMDRVLSSASSTTSSGTVIDAAAKFDERRWAQYHPQLPGPALKRILEKLFGNLRG